MSISGKSTDLMYDNGVVIASLRVNYGIVSALRSVDLNLAPGQITGIVGPNGAGKSSLINALSGAVKSSGFVSVGGLEISDYSPAERAKMGIGLVPQGRQIFPTLTVEENLSVFAEVLGAQRGVVAQALERFPRLRDRKSTLAGNLSGGEQQMLAVTRGMMTECRVVLFDEMTTGLAPRVVQDLLLVARELARDGAVVILAEASSNLIRDFVDSGIVLMRGSVVDVVRGGDELDRAYRERMGMNV